MGNISISVITVCLNAVDTIEQTIQSVLGQTYDNVEYIIIDGGSTDGTLDIVEKYRERIDFFVSEPDDGLYNAMNKGTRPATGDYVHFLNADDYYCDDNVVADVAAATGNSSDVELIYGNVLLLHDNGVFKRKSAPETLTRESFAKQGFCHQALFASRDLFRRTGGFSERYKVISDGDWLMRCMIDGVISKYVDRDIAVFRKGGVCSTVDWRTEKKEFLKNYYSKWEVFKWRKLPQFFGWRFR